MELLIFLLSFQFPINGMLYLLIIQKKTQEGNQLVECIYHSLINTICFQYQRLLHSLSLIRRFWDDLFQLPCKDMHVFSLQSIFVHRYNFLNFVNLIFIKEYKSVKQYEKSKDNLTESLYFPTLVEWPECLSVTGSTL